MTSPNELPTTNSTETFEPVEQNRELTVQERALEILETAPKPVAASERRYVRQQGHIVSSGFNDAKMFLAGHVNSLEVNEEASDEDNARSELAKKLISQIQGLDEGAQTAFYDELRKATEEHAISEYKSLIDNWNNPTGLLQESFSVTMGSNLHDTCGVDGCPHMYGGASTKLSIDDGKGRPVEPTSEASIIFTNNAQHLLEEHPQTDKSIAIAQQIIELHERALAH